MDNHLQDGREAGVPVTKAKVEEALEAASAQYARYLELAKVAQVGSSASTRFGGGGDLIGPSAPFSLALYPKASYALLE